MRHILVSALAGLLSCAAACAQGDQALQTSIQRALDSPYCSDVRVSVQKGVITLTGTVDLYITKMFAEKRATEIGRRPVHDEIEVAGLTLPDRQLKTALRDAIDHRNIPGSAEASRWISIGVKKGVVTLAGHANEATLSAVSIAVAKVAGVKDLILNVRVYSNDLPREPIEWPAPGQSVGGVSTQ